MTTETPSQRSAGTHALVAAWLVLLLAWGSGTTFNVYHATHTGHMRLALALLAGIIPALLSMCLSHIVASYHGGKFMTVVTFAVMIGAMAMSIGATAAVLGTTFGWMGWLYGGVLDAASLLALQVILNGPARKAEAEAVLESARTEARQATAALALARAEASQMASDLASAQADLEAMREAMERAKEEATGEPDAKPSRTPRATPGGASREPEAIKARAAYRRSVAAGKPLTDRALGAMFDRGRTWGGNRIDECQGGPKLAQAQ